MLKLVKYIRHKIRVLKRGEISKRTLKTGDATIQMELHNTRAMETESEPIFIQDSKEHQAVVTDVVSQIENSQVCNKYVQTEALSSSTMANQTFCTKETQTVGTRYCNKKTQVDLQPKNVLIKNDPGIAKLREDLA